MGKRRTSFRHHSQKNLGLFLLLLRPWLNMDDSMDGGDSSVKMHHHKSSVAQRHYNLGRSMFSKRSRCYYDQHYQWQNSGNHSNRSTSRGKISPLHDDQKLSFKFAGTNSESGCQPDGKFQASGRPERIRSSLLVMDAISPDKMKMICGICQKHLSRKPSLFGNALASELSVVAILVCGHAYHADCLEQRTSFENRCDPPCPLCSDSPSQV
ncbi:Inorganic H pyrophosphatase family protein isoform 1 [Hibiscus syriacus]|uniref:Inorganic H pyrophosphatase family protein isoform 1 n=1 Tax=Hibiscus syriacus TaxID=106335 RepID=A0A6A2XDQ1_HIBSY|nr:Inorganic H pyrophosphatase family protein isoform 1 [Hibiscus syriacus]